MIKEHFKDYTEKDNMLKELYLDLEVVNNKLYGISSAGFDEKVRSNAPQDNKLYYIAKRDEIQERIDILEDQKKELFDVHQKEIAKVSDERSRSILRCCFLLRQSSYEIAKLLNISINHFFKLKGKAIYEFKIKNDIK